MRIDWLFFPNVDLDGGWPYVLPTECWLFHSSHFHIPGSAAIQEVLSCFSRLAGAMVFCAYGGSNSSFRQKLSDSSCGSRNNQSGIEVKNFRHLGCNPMGLDFGSEKRTEFTAPLCLGKIVNGALRHWKEVEQFHSVPIFSLAAALVPPLDKLSPKVVAAPLENIAEHMSGNMEPFPCSNEHRGCAKFSVSEISWTRDAVEPRTGIKFPKVLDKFWDGHDIEVLVGTGSRSMKIIKVKSLKIYAFGLYIHPYSVCKKLGPKYASVPVNELNNQSDFFDDLLREDIDMTVRLVISYSGLKISAVKDAFEKSLRNRLQKVNPETDYHCLRAFGSYFTQDIPLPVGTTIDFRQTADGQLITEIGGKQIGAVRSKELCRAFFDMYIGDMPVSVQAKEDVARNVAGLMRRC